MPRPPLLAACVLAVSLCAGVAGAQAGPGPNGPYAPLPPTLQQQLLSLADQPARHTGFVLDRNMMEIARNALESGGLDPRRAAAALTGISFDQYHYDRPAFYEPEMMQSLLEGYRLAGWKHLVNGNQTPANSAQPTSMITDLWLHFSGADIDALTVMTRGPRDMNVVQVTGDLRPLDLLHLGGHFGIPKVDPNAVMVPDGQGPPPVGLQRR